MTPTEYELMKLRMQTIAQSTLLKWVSDLLLSHYSTLPADEQSHVLSAMKTKIFETVQDYSDLTLPNLHPAESDAQTAEFQDAFAIFSKDLLNKFEALG